MTTCVEQTRRTLNFSAGPAVLPEPVLEQARADLWNIDETGIGVLEHSHRGPSIDRVFEEAEAACRRVGDVPDDWSVLFLQGGASMQFAMHAKPPFLYSLKIVAGVNCFFKVSLKLISWVHAFQNPCRALQSSTAFLLARRRS